MPPEPARAAGSGELGVYVHIPFCARRCDYCAFATWTDRDHLVGEYLDAVVREIERAVDDGLLADSGRPVTSVFFGGGTPSLVAPEALVRVLAALPTSAGAEVTVECNPDTVSAALFDTYRRGGVNRISLGVQSMVPHVLTSLGRTHDVEGVARAVADARRTGFDNLNLDLIYGGAGESVDDWAASLDRVLELEPEHVSAYALTVETGTPLAADPDRHPDDDDQADKYELAAVRLAGAGLEWYEISNWAEPGHECQHNLLYWAQGDYLPVGAAAHGHRDGRRAWNLRTPERYVAAVAAGESPEAGAEELDAATRAEEAFVLAVRTRSGAPVPPGAEAAAADLAAVGLLDLDAGRARLTRRGRLLASDVTTRLLLAADSQSTPPGRVALGTIDC
jgi:putative oxygen-independent coproporphyrinogen III oxidase